jgi:hypothetical protein
MCQSSAHLGENDLIFALSVPTENLGLEKIATHVLFQKLTISHFR